jgi:hypothetical protein
MDITTSNRIYDEIALTVGMRLQDLGDALAADQIDILATDVDRDAGVDMACSLGRLAVDSDDRDAIDRAVEAQKDRIRSIMSMHAPRDPAFVAVQRQDLSEAKLRLRLLKAYIETDRPTMLRCLQDIMAAHQGRRP